MNRPFRQQIELTLSLVKRDLKSRYKDSVLGFVWSLFRPAFLTVIIWVVFSVILQHPFEDHTIPPDSLLAAGFGFGSDVELLHRSAGRRDELGDAKRQPPEKSET